MPRILEPNRKKRYCSKCLQFGKSGPHGHYSYECEEKHTKRGIKQKKDSRGKLLSVSFIKDRPKSPTVEQQEEIPTQLKTNKNTIPAETTQALNNTNKKKENTIHSNTEKQDLYIIKEIRKLPKQQNQTPITTIRSSLEHLPNNYVICDHINGCHCCKSNLRAHIKHEEYLEKELHKIKIENNKKQNALDKLKKEDWKIKEMENLKILVTNLQHRRKEAETKNKTDDTTIINLNVLLAQQNEKLRLHSIEEIISSF